MAGAGGRRRQETGAGDGQAAGDYLVRQMIDFQKGNRNGPGAKLMKPVVANLTMQDIIAIAAYVSSRSPEASKPATTARR